MKGFVNTRKVSAAHILQSTSISDRATLPTVVSQCFLFDFLHFEFSNDFYGCQTFYLALKSSLFGSGHQRPNCPQTAMCMIC